jgi:prepilin-type N-terminal cleavage/methylation domain-containing protein
MIQILQRRRGLTIVELLVCTLIIGLLAAITIPAVNAVRESARIQSCKNNLKQIADAACVFESNKKHFPSGRNAAKAQQHSWGTSLLPYIEQEELFFRYDSSVRWNSAKNIPVVGTDISTYRCPSTDRICDGQSDYAGNYGSSLTGLRAGFEPDQAWSSGLLITVNLDGNRQRPVQSEKVRDGLSNTFMIVECAGLTWERGGGWGNGHHCVSHDSGRINESRSLRIFADHANGANVAFGDSRIQFMSVDTDLYVLGALSTRSRGETIVASY